MVADQDQRGVMLLREPRQADGHLAGQRRGAVEHHQAERAAAEQDVGAPGAPVGAGRADHPESAAVSRLSPLTRGQRARPVDDRHPAPRRNRGEHQLPDECGPPAAERPLNLGQPPAGNPAIGQRVIQRLDPGGDRGGTTDPRGCQNRRQLLAECGD